ncbi:MAG TPA: sugar transferase [Gemmatimonadaceae bacterium]
MSAAKRACDVLGAAVGLVVLSPLLVAIALAIALVDGRPVLFRHERVGRRGRLFRMWKFRTMVVGAERKGPHITPGGDPRVTRLGRWLRRRKLDELPQLVNVLRGEMSLVGPRPEVPRYVARYTAAEREVLRLVPGITDPASIRYADEGALLARAADPERLYVEEVMPEKIRLNLEYARRATPLTDIATVAATLLHLGGTRARPAPTSLAGSAGQR